MSDINEKLVSYASDLAAALRIGWLGIRGYDEEPCCAYCDEKAEYSMETKRHLCKHDPDCLMTKYADLISFHELLDEYGEPPMTDEQYLESFDRYVKILEQGAQK